MNRMCTYGCLFSIFIIVGCGGGSSDDDDSGGAVNGDDGNGGIVSDDGNGGIVSDDGNGGIVSDDGNGGIVSDDGNGGIVSDDGNGGIVSDDGNGGVVSDDGNGGVINGGVISGDDGNGSVTAATATDLQGTFASACEVDAGDGTSEQTEFTFSGNNVTASNITSFATALCDGVTSLSINASFTFSVDGTQTPLAVGSANNIDLIFSSGSITGSQALLDTLQSQGTTLAAFLSAQGLTGDINNLGIEDFGLNQAESFDIFRLDTTADGTDRLTFGDTSGSFTGEAPALRPTSLDPDPNAVLLRIL